MSSPRIRSIDILRGLVMVIMALDHSRDYFSDFKFDPTDLARAGAALFITRWIAHFCAPVFIFLAGTSAYISHSKTNDTRKTAFKLFTRGLWLILLELTIIRFGWAFRIDYSVIVLQVIWVIGRSMVVLSALVFTPPWFILSFSIIVIAGHNMLDHFAPAAGMDALWKILHVQDTIYTNGGVIYVVYPLIPWIAVMSAGYCFGRVMTLPEAPRHKWRYITGAGMVALFILLRYINVYGDPHPWIPQAA